MPATVVLGAQWGDEGKGKLVDRLAGQADWVVRFQGGNNAGHTVVLGERTIKLHLLPSGITRESCELVLGDGMVIDPWVLMEELQRWQSETGEMPLGTRLHISDRAHVILPFHRMVDGLDKKIGTTGRGIGPTYADKINRIGLRFGDIAELLADESALNEMASRQADRLQYLGLPSDRHAISLRDDIQWIHDNYSQAIQNTGVMVDTALSTGQQVLLEGAQGCLLDIDQGTFPFVTSSITSRGNSTHGAGVHPGHVEETIGVVKAYTTRVGHGPMPTELFDEVGTHLGEVGHEFGTTTGRPRRCGWLDLVVLRHSQRVNGFSSLALTKLDVLGGLETISICIGYELDGVEIRDMPASAKALARCKPILIDLPGFEGLSLEKWLEIAKQAAIDRQGFAALPEAAQHYIAHIEQLLGVPVSSVGIGPDRDATIDATD
ncbi:adenylosuccinate synthase [Deltaproteobacteria bacterium]|nr:adenylosuccinate synthase [Deltaproteobacteria bacterium]